MPQAIDRDQHLDTIKQTFFAYMEAVRRRQHDESWAVQISLKKLGLDVKFREPQILDPDDPGHRPRY